MVQTKIREQLVKLNAAISGTYLSCDEIIRNRKIDPNIWLHHNTELSGKVALEAHVSVEKYGTLGEKLDYGTARDTR